MRNENRRFYFSIFKYKLKIEKEMSFFNFQFWIKIEIHKNSLFHYNFKMKIEWHFWCTDFNPCTESIIHFLIWKQNGFWIFFIFRFSISLPKLKTERIFWNSLLDFKSKNEFENFDFCFLKLVLNQNRLKKRIVFVFYFFM